MDQFVHCTDKPSILFSNLYTDIWAPGGQGTNINENNHFARYVWLTAQHYKDQVTFWEVLNAPGYDPEGDNAWKPTGIDGNWWDFDPDPCDYALHAPVQHYIRMLRIAYEVIHAVDNEALVTLTGIGEQSFLDVVLRNTDNPHDGSPNALYPHAGGAYFDAIGVTVFPFLDNSTNYYDNVLGQLVYARHSDAAIKSLTNRQAAYNEVLANYGFGSVYPDKQWTVSVANIPIQQVGNFMGGEIAQLNFLMKGRVWAEKHGFKQWVVEQLAETGNTAGSATTDGLMGLFAQLPDSTDYNNAYTRMSAVGLASMSKILTGCKYDAVRTTQLNLPSHLDGAAFKSANGSYHYVLWAKTTIDLAEPLTTMGTYSFPDSWALTQVYKRAWNYWQTNQTDQVLPINLELSSSPVIISESPDLLDLPTVSLPVASPSSICPEQQVTYMAEVSNSDSIIWHFQGGEPSTSTETNPVVTYNQAGVYSATVTAYNMAGQTTATNQAVEVLGTIEPAFSYNINNLTVQLTATFVEGYTYLWLLPDGQTSNGVTPQFTVDQTGLYEVALILTNTCGSDTTIQTVNVGQLPVAQYDLEMPSPLCAGSFVTITNTSLNYNTVTLLTNGAEIISFIGQSLVLQYSQPGSYILGLVVTDLLGQTSSAVQVLEVLPTAPPQISLSLAGSNVLFASSTAQGYTQHWTITGGNESFSINGPTANVSFATLPTSVSVQLAYQNSCVSDVMSVTFALTPTAVAVVQKNCADLTALLDATTSNIATDFSWQIAGGSPATSNNAQTEVVFSESGQYDYTLIVNNLYGSDTTQGIITLQNTHLSFAETLCVGDTFCVIPANKCYVFNDAHADTIQLTQSPGCDTIITVNLDWQPVHKIQISDTILIGQTYTFGDLSLQQAGIYYQSLVSQAGCDSTVTLYLTVVDTIGTQNDPSFTWPLVQPNPFSNYITISNLPMGRYVATLSDAQHRVWAVSQSEIQVAREFTWQISEQSIPAGTYLLTLQSSDRYWSWLMVNMP
jgi:PKD repeat protein